MREKRFWAGVRAATPTVFGYLSIGLAFGIVAAKSGISPLETGLMSILIYAGSGQFALAALILVQAPLTSIALTIFLVNLRHFLMNLHTSTIFSKASFPQQILIGSFLTDESYGVMLGHHILHQEVSPFWMYGNNAASYLSWILATITGSLVGGFIPNPHAFGIDFALIAMFVAIFASQLQGILQKVALQKIVWILLVVLVSYFGFSRIISASLAVLMATLLGCLTGVVLDD